MTLRRKTLLIVGLALFSLVAAVYAASSYILLSGFSDLEDNMLRTRAQRVNKVIENELDRLEATAHDYAAWDESFNFSAGNDPKFPDRYLAPESIQKLNVDTIVYAPLGNAPVFAKSYDLKTMQENNIASKVTAMMTVKDGLMYGPNVKIGKRGIIRAGTNFLLFAMHPILPTDEKASNNGTLLIARTLDATMLAKLGDLTQLTLTVNGVVGDLPDDFARAWDELRHGDSGPYYANLDGNTSAAYIPLLDQSRKPIALLRATADRSIYTQAKMASAYLLAALLVLGIVFSLITLFILERLVIGRVERITQEVSHIGMGSDLDARVTVSGHDELGVLAQKVNHLLETFGGQIDLEQAVVNAQLTTEAKSTFLANMSHELRTPLNAIIGYSELLQEYVGDEGMGGLIPDLQKIVEAAKHLQSIIANILDISKIEAGKMDLDYAPFDLHECVQAVTDIVAVKAKEKSLRLTTSMAANVPQHVVGDVARLRQILVNLLNNAVKFTERGDVELTIDAQRLTKAPDKPQWEIAFAVRDSGIGIPAQRFDRLFKTFSQVDASSSRKYGGTGLGLAISKQLCEMMGGRMSVESVENAGSTFHFTVRLEEKPV